jgi:hypothetical protein
VSERFRKQLHYVLIGNHQNRWQRAITNEISPEMQLETATEPQKITLEAIELF